MPCLIRIVPQGCLSGHGKVQGTVGGGGTGLSSAVLPGGAGKEGLGCPGAVRRAHGTGAGIDRGWARWRGAEGEGEVERRMRRHLLIVVFLGLISVVCACVCMCVRVCLLHVFTVCACWVC